MRLFSFPFSLHEVIVSRALCAFSLPFFIPWNYFYRAVYVASLLLFSVHEMVFKELQMFFLSSPFLSVDMKTRCVASSLPLCGVSATYAALCPCLERSFTADYFIFPFSPTSLFSSRSLVGHTRADINKQHARTHRHRQTQTHRPTYTRPHSWDQAMLCLSRRQVCA